MVVQLNESSGKFEETGMFDHPYPTTKLMWVPDRAGSRSDLLATTGDYLRIWNVTASGDVILRSLLNNNKNR